MTIADLVAHLRRWLSDPMVQPKAFYARYLDQATRMTDGPRQPHQEPSMSITQTQALTRGLEADGWTRHEHVSRHPCWTKALPNKSGGTTQMFVFVGANGSARWTMARPLVGESRPIPEGRRQLLLWKGGFTPMSATQHDPA